MWLNSATEQLRVLLIMIDWLFVYDLRNIFAWLVLNLFFSLVKRSLSPFGLDIFLLIEEKEIFFLFSLRKRVWKFKAISSLFFRSSISNRRCKVCVLCENSSRTASPYQSFIDAFVTIKFPVPPLNHFYFSFRKKYEAFPWRTFNKRFSLVIRSCGLSIVFSYFCWFFLRPNKQSFDFYPNSMFVLETTVEESRWWWTWKLRHWNH